MRPTKDTYVVGVCLLLAALLNFCSGCAALEDHGAPEYTTIAGPSGAPGPAGSPGVGGSQGAPGKDGSNGKSLVSTAIQSPPDACPNGGSVLLIAQDTLGTGVWDASDADQTSILTCNGQVGAVGATGAPGVDTTPIEMVQFCSGYTTSYPATFPEYGACVAGMLFAVYWDGRNAWLSEVVPGYYASTSTSAPCNFTVGDNCAVSQ